MLIPTLAVDHVVMGTNVDNEVDGVLRAQEVAALLVTFQVTITRELSCPTSNLSQLTRLDALKLISIKKCRKPHGSSELKLCNVTKAYHI